MENYYQSPDLKRAVKALDSLIRYQDSDLGNHAPFVYFFLRLAQMEAGIADRLREALSRASLQPTDVTEVGRRIIADLTNQLSNLSRLIHACDREVKSPTGNDLLWMEFCLTGSTRPVIHLIDQLERPDTVRKQLSVWLSDSPSLLQRWWRRRRCRSLKSKLGIDIERQTINSPQDLDCQTFMVDCSLTKERYQLAMKVLPFSLTDDDFNQIMIKCTAKWSLASQSANHPIVLETCEQEILRRSERIRLSLSDIIAWAQAEPARAAFEQLNNR